VFHVPADEDVAAPPAPTVDVHQWIPPDPHARHVVAPPAPAAEGDHIMLAPGSTVPEAPKAGFFHLDTAVFEPVDLGPDAANPVADAMAAHGGGADAHFGMFFPDPQRFVEVPTLGATQVATATAPLFATAPPESRQASDGGFTQYLFEGLGLDAVQSFLRRNVDCSFKRGTPAAF